MLGDFKLSKSVGKYFGDAYDLFKLGAKFYDAVKADEKEERHLCPRRHSILTLIYARPVRLRR